MADTSLQRKNMVESQVRPSDITDRRITRAMLEIPREAFLPKESRDLAYADTDVSLSRAPPRLLLAPRTFAKLVQLASPDVSDHVLDVGAGGGYSAAVLSRLAKSVVALEWVPALANLAREALTAQGIANVSVVAGNAADGHPALAPYDVIVLEGSVAEVPAALLGQLREGGRLVAIVGSEVAAEARLYVRRGETVSEGRAFSATAPRLTEATEPAAFMF